MFVKLSERMSHQSRTTPNFSVDLNHIRKLFFMLVQIAKSSIWPWGNKRHTS